MSPATPDVVIIGGGFAGLWCTRALASAPVRITLVDKANHHLFQPLLYQVATAGLSAPDIAAPLRHILRRQRNVQVLMAEVAGIDVDGKTVQLGRPVASQTLHYDQLLVASGATHAYFGHDEWAAHAPGLKTLDDALAIRRRVLLAFEQAEAATSEEDRRAWLHFAIVGGGPTGVELAGTLAEIARHTLRDEFRRFDPRQTSVRLIEAGTAPLASFPPALQQRTKTQLESLGVQVCCGTPVADITIQGYRLGDRFISCRTALWAAGVAASPLGAMLGVPLDRSGRVKVNPDLTLPGHPEVFVAGDLAALSRPDGRPVPGVAPAAKQMGRHVARSLCARLAGGSAQPFVQPFVYADHGNLATIGRMAAVVDLRGFQFSGLLAWWFWLAAHVFFLIGFRNRVSVLLNWALAYWTYQRGARIVLVRTVPRSARHEPAARHASARAHGWRPPPPPPGAPRHPGRARESDPPVQRSSRKSAPTSNGTNTGRKTRKRMPIRSGSMMPPRLPQVRTVAPSGPSQMASLVRKCLNTAPRPRPLGLRIRTCFFSALAYRRRRQLERRLCPWGNGFQRRSFTMTMTSPLTATSKLEPEANSRPVSRHDGKPPGDTPLTNAELVQLRIRVIALENLVIALLAEAPDRQLALARGMADYISPRTGCTPHPVTLRAADEMLSLVNRADRYPRPLRP